MKRFARLSFEQKQTSDGEPSVRVAFHSLRKQDMSITVLGVRVEDIKEDWIGRNTKIYRVGSVSIYLHRDKRPKYHVVTRGSK